MKLVAIVILSGASVLLAALFLVIRNFHTEKPAIEIWVNGNETNVITTNIATTNYWIVQSNTFEFHGTPPP